MVTGASAAVAILGEVAGASEGNMYPVQVACPKQAATGVMVDKFGEPVPETVIVAEAFCEVTAA